MNILPRDVHLSRTSRMRGSDVHSIVVSSTRKLIENSIVLNSIKMQPNSLVIFILGASLVTLMSQQVLIADAQIFDQLINGANSRNNAADQPQNMGSRFGSMFRDMMSVNVP